jgi:hypothetical protein
MRQIGRATHLAVAALLALSAMLVQYPTPAQAATLRVPQHFQTIQAAIDAAAPGDTVRVSPGTFTEQLVISKDLTLVGAGVGATTVRAPAVLVPGQAGTNSIIEIRGGASVAISRLKVAGPGSGSCTDGALRTGIRVFAGGHLELRYAAVVDIHDAVSRSCGRSGNAISGGAASADIQYALLRNYQSSAYVMVGGTTTFAHNLVIGAGLSPDVATTGVEIVAGGTGTITDNVISGNQCGSPSLGCGPDFFSELQLAGVSAGAGVVISRNLLINNQVGAYVSETASLDHNIIVGSDYFGLAFQDGDMTSTKDRITGGGGGVAIIASAVDTTATLNGITIAVRSGPAVQKFESGFSATVVKTP